ncbi:MAG TPA: alpha/beta hydrolase [Solirubrobacterales bacterium]|nr:alpha/beta hydrolase [Solirubrobacterales bacterium]
MEILEIDGRRLSYTDTGSGPPLVFVHGVGTSGEIWADDLAPLARDCRLIAYDRRGYGASSASPRDWRQHRADAEALIEALDAAPAVLVGYSGGSMVTLPLVLERPDLVSALVLLDPAFNIESCRTAGLVRTVLGAQMRRRLFGERRGAEHWMRYVSSYSTGGCAYEKASPQRRERLLENASAVFDDYASDTEDVDESRLASIDVPVTIIDAALSPTFLRRSSERLKRLLPQARTITLEHSGHYVSVDARDELLTVLREAIEVPK